MLELRAATAARHGLAAGVQLLGPTATLV